MAITWDKAKVWIINETGYTMTLASASLDSGKWSKKPDPNPQESMPVNESEEKAFAAQSRDSATVGPSGTVEYGIGDGTVFNFYFNVPYSGSQQLKIGVSGASAANYTVTKKQKKSSDTSGPSKNVKWVVTIKAN